MSFAHWRRRFLALFVPLAVLLLAMTQALPAAADYGAVSIAAQPPVFGGPGGGSVLPALTTTIQYEIGFSGACCSGGGDTVIEIINSGGTTVRTFNRGLLVQGTYNDVIWDGTDDSGALVPDGLYTLRLTVTDNNVFPVLVTSVENTVLLDRQGPITSDFTLPATPVNPTDTFNVSATISDATTGNQNVVFAEYWVDAAGPDGTAPALQQGVPVGGPTAIFTFTFDPVALGLTLSPGTHHILIHGADAAGNWGPYTVRSFEVAPEADVAACSNPLVTPNVTDAQTIDITASGTFEAPNGATVTAVEFFLDSVGANGSGVPGTVSGAGPAFTGSHTFLAAPGNPPPAGINGLAPGLHTIWMHARTGAGPTAKWGPLCSVTFTVSQDTEGPLSTNLQFDVAGNPPVYDATGGATAVNFTWDASDAGRGDHNVVAARFFIDTFNPDGTGSTGITFPPPTPAISVVGIAGSIPAATVNSLASGDHQLWVQAQDSEGNWGPAIFRTFRIQRASDTGGDIPVCTSAPVASPGVISQLMDVTATAQFGTSGGVNITAVEFFLDSIGPDGSGVPADPFTPAPSVTATHTFDDATPPPSGLAGIQDIEGVHTIWVHAATGTPGNLKWGPLCSTTFVLDPGPVGTNPTVNGSSTPVVVDGTAPVTIRFTAVAQFPNIPIPAARYFIDVFDNGGGGSIPMTLVAGGVGTADFEATISVAQLSALPSGDHIVYMQARDNGVSPFNWGEPAIISFRIQRPSDTGADIPQCVDTPQLSRDVTNLDPTDPAQDITASFFFETPTPPGVPITAVEFFLDTRGGNGTGVLGTITPNPSASDVIGSHTYSRLVAPPSGLANLSEGRHTIWAHAATGDVANRVWGPFCAITFFVDKSGPDALNATAAPAVNNGDQIETIQFTGDDTLHGNSNVTEAQFFIDNFDGTPDATIPATAPLTPVEAFQWNIPAATIAGLADGRHQVWMRAKDASGFWGPPAVVFFDINRGGPLTVINAHGPDPNNGEVPENVQFNVSDVTTGNSNVVKAEIFIDSIGSDGTGGTIPFSYSVAAAPPAPSVNFSFDIPLVDIQQLADGDHTIHIHGQDATGKWGPFASVKFTIRRDREGPITTIAAPPNPVPAVNDGTVNEVLTIASVSDVTTGNHNVVAIECFLDNRGDPASVCPLPPLPPPAPTIGPLTITIPAATIAALSDGTHTIWVRGRDSLGNWGPFVSAVFKKQKDIVGPTVPLASLSVLPPVNPPVPPVYVNEVITATCDDTASGNHNIAAAEFFLDVQGQPGSGTAMTAINPVGFNLSPITQVQGIIPAAQVAALADGQHTVYVRCQDDQGNWGPFTSGTFIKGSDTQGPLSQITNVNPLVTDGLDIGGNAVPGEKVTFNWTSDDTNRGNNNVVAIFGYLDSTPLNPCTAPDPRVTLVITSPIGIVINGTGEISAANVQALTDGTHTIYVQGRDAVGNCGPLASATFQVIRDRLGPITSNVTMTPNPYTGVGNLTVTALVDDRTTGNHRIRAAEMFFDAPGAPGTGIPMQAVPPKTFDPGLNPDTFLDVTVTIPQASVPASFLTPGPHQICVRGQDNRLNWGDAVCSTTVIDGDGPVTVDLNVPNGVDGLPGPQSLKRFGPGQTIQFRATAHDADSTIASATLTLKHLVGSGPLQADVTVAMQAQDGTFNQRTEALVASYAADSLAEGQWQATAKSTDSNGNVETTNQPIAVLFIVDRSSPTVRDMSAVPDPTGRFVTVTGTGDDGTSAATPWGSPLAAMWYKIDSLAEQPLPAVDGGFDEAQETASLKVDLQAIGLTTGEHLVYFRARDQVGNTSALFGPVRFRLDQQGPEVRDIVARAQDENGPVLDANNGANQAIFLTAVIDDTNRGGQKIKAAEYFFFVPGSPVFKDPGPGNGKPMSPTDGAFDEVVEDVQVFIDVKSMPNGNQYQLCVRGQDEVDNWGDTECVDPFIINHTAPTAFVTYDLASGTWLVTGADTFGNPLSAPEPSENGTHDYTLTDNAGNTTVVTLFQQNAGSVPYRVNAQAAVMEVIYNGKSQPVTPNSLKSVGRGQTQVAQTYSLAKKVVGTMTFNPQRKIEKMILRQNGQSQTFTFNTYRSIRLVIKNGRFTVDEKLP